MRNRPIIIIDTTNAPTYCRSHCYNEDCSRHISKGMAYTGYCKFEMLKNTEDCEGYISRRQQKNNKCELCGESCRERVAIKNRINGNELKICNECMEKFQFEQETGDTRKKEIREKWRKM